MAPGPALLEELGLSAVLAAVPESAREVLDLCCGDGSLGAAIKERAQRLGTACRVTGVEADAALASQARGRLDEVVTGHPERIALPFLPKSFDAVVALGCFDTFTRPDRMAGYVGQYLRPRGRLLLATGSLDAAQVLRDARLAPVAAPGRQSALVVAERPLSPSDFPNIPSVAIVTVVRDQVAALSQLLESVGQSEQEVEYRVVIVDNASRDAAAGLSTSDGGSIIVVHNESDQGMVGGLVQGVRAARSKIVVTLSPDSTVGAGFLSSVIDAFLPDRNIAAVSPLVLSPTGAVLEAGVEGEGGRSQPSYRSASITDPGVSAARPVTSLDLAACAFRWTAFEMVGGFDTSLEIGAAGGDFAAKLLGAQWALLYEPSVRVVSRAP